MVKDNTSNARIMGSITESVLRRFFPRVQSCVAPALSRGDGPRYPRRRNTANIRKI